MNDDIIAQVAAIDIFRALPKGQVMRLVDTAEQVTHQVGENVTTEGGDAATFHFILAGKARVTHNGTELAMLGPGGYFGEISLIDGLPRSATVTAEETLTTLSLRRAQFKLLVRGNPAFSEALNIELCARIRAAEARA